MVAEDNADGSQYVDTTGLETWKQPEVIIKMGLSL